MSSNNMFEERHKLKTCIEKYEQRIDNLLNTLGWTKENTLREHKSNKPLSEFRENKYDKNDPLYPDTLLAKNFVKFDTETIKKIFNSPNKCNLPQKFSDIQINYNDQEKLSLYQYVIDKTGNLTEPEVTILHLMDNDGISSNKQMTFSEIVAMRRNQKRRRVKYRTTKSPPLSVTEELRHVIEIQMQAFNQYITNATNQCNEKKHLRKNSSREHKKNRHKTHKVHKHEKNSKKRNLSL